MSTVGFLTEAEIRQRTARVRVALLRSAGKLVMPPGFEKIPDRPCHVHAPRRHGKTKFLLWHADVYEGGNCVIIGHTRSSTLNLKQVCDEIRRPGFDPVFTCASEAEDFLQGREILPIYCDEWWAFPERAKRFLCGLPEFRLGIGTNPDMGDEVMVYPL